MKQIDYDAADALLNHTDFKSGNTEVLEEFTGTNMYLHGNCIATLNGSELTLNSCGWKTATTKARLNGILTQYGFTVSQSKREWFVNGNIPFIDGMVIDLDTKGVIK